MTFSKSNTLKIYIDVAKQHSENKQIFKKKPAVLERVFSSWIDLMSIGYQS